jgi:hypothetical protein
MRFAHITIPGSLLALLSKPHESDQEADSLRQDGRHTVRTYYSELETSFITYDRAEM